MSSVASDQSNAPSHMQHSRAAASRALGSPSAHAPERVGVEPLPDLGRVLHVLPDVVGLVDGLVLQIGLVDGLEHADVVELDVFAGRIVVVADGVDQGHRGGRVEAQSGHELVRFGRVGPIA